MLGLYKFQIGNEKFVVDPNSLSVFKVDNIYWDVLDELAVNQTYSDIIQNLAGKYPIFEITKTIEAIDKLKQEGQIFAEDSYATYELSYDFPPLLYDLCLNVSHVCNMKCGYCFALGGAYGKEKMVMDKRTAKNAIDFLVEKSDPKEKDTRIGFFGGEPLLNFDIIRYAIEYARHQETKTGKEFHFSITTNGTLLSNFLPTIDSANMLSCNASFSAYLKQNKLSFIISIDGPRPENDKIRLFNDGKGTYDIVVPQIKDFLKDDYERVTLRSTYTHETIHFSDFVIHLLEDIGGRSISVEPAFVSKDSNYYLDEHDLSIADEEYGKIASYYLDKLVAGEFFDFFPFRIHINQIYKREKHTTECGAGYGYIAVTPSGDIYPCHWFPGMDQYKMGNVNTGWYDMNLVEKFRSVWVNAKEKCKACWAKYFCGGGCSAHAVMFNEDILNPYYIECELTKIRIRYSIWLYNALDEKGILDEYIKRYCL